MWGTPDTLLGVGPTLSALLDSEDRREVDAVAGTRADSSAATAPLIWAPEVILPPTPSRPSMSPTEDSGRTDRPRLRSPWRASLVAWRMPLEGSSSKPPASGRSARWA